MPRWLRTQMRRAFLGKDLRQIRLLNECWFLYNERQDDWKARQASRQRK